MLPVWFITDGGKAFTTTISYLSEFTPWPEVIAYWVPFAVMWYLIMCIWNTDMRKPLGFLTWFESWLDKIGPKAIVQVAWVEGAQRVNLDKALEMLEQKQVKVVIYVGDEDQMVFIRRGEFLSLTKLSKGSTTVGKFLGRDWVGITALGFDGEFKSILQKLDCEMSTSYWDDVIQKIEV